jgi:CHAT domain-containing protein
MRRLQKCRLQFLKVDDDSTAQLMAALYRGMFQGGLSPAAALRQAQLQLWRTGKWSSPYYWAGFILQGDYR